MGKAWTEMAMVSWKVQFHFLCGRAQNDHENPTLESQAPVQELNLGPLEWETEMPTAVLLCHAP